MLLRSSVCVFALRAISKGTRIAKEAPVFCRIKTFALFKHGFHIVLKSSYVELLRHIRLIFFERYAFPISKQHFTAGKISTYIERISFGAMTGQYILRAFCSLRRGLRRIRIKCYRKL